MRLSWPPSFAERVAYCALVMLAVVNVALTLEFWSTIGGDKPILFQFLGGGLALIEITALVVITEANSRGETAKARVWLVAFVLVLVLGLAGDFGALFTRSSRDAQERSVAIARYDAAVTDQSDATAEIQRLSGELDQLHARRPIDALKAERDDAVARRDRHVAAGISVPRTVAARAVATESALATARELVRAEARRQTAQALLSEYGRRPDSTHPQLQGIVALLAMVGLKISPENLGAILACYAALVLKFVLVFGFWALTPSSGAWRVDKDVAKATPNAILVQPAPDDVPTSTPAVGHSSSPPSMGGLAELEDWEA